jgi:dipeptidyl aminopeptidase/acylaminoacyl peptidase
MTLRGFTSHRGANTRAPVRNQPMKLLRLPFAVFALLLVPLHGADELKPGANLVVEGIPAIPKSLVEEVKRYTEARSAGFAGWHPTRVEMLVSTRFGNAAQLHAVAAPLGQRRQLTFFDEPVSSSGYDRRDGKFFLFRRDEGGSEFAQIYRYDLADGTVTRLTDGGRHQNGGTNWSNRGDLIAYGSTRRNGTDRDLYVMDPRDPGTDRRVLEVKGGGWGVADWSPDDRTLLVSEYLSINESHLWTVDVATGEKRELTPRARKGVAYGGAQFSRDGHGVFVTTDRDFEFQRLAYIDRRTGLTTYLTTDIRHDIAGFSLSDDGRRLVFVANEHGLSRAYLMDTATRRYRVIAGLPVAVTGGGAWHRDSRHVAFTVSSPRSAADVHVLDADTGAVTRWTESELGGLVAATLSEAELIRWRSFDDREITGFLYRPPARFTGPRPVIISIHGGPESQSRPVFQAHNNYFMNELGIAIIHPNVRGSSGYGKSFLLLDNGPRREDSVKDIGALLDWVAGQPGLDASRIMVTGGSYGGYMSLATAVHYSDRIRCAVDIVGISNFISFLENTESYRRDLRRAEYGDERDPAMRAIFEQISPLNHAARITKPLFVIQGANDPRVPRSEAIQIVETMRRHGRPAWYLEARDEGHGFAKKPNRDYQFYATVLFVKQFLLGDAGGAAGPVSAR